MYLPIERIPVACSHTHPSRVQPGHEDLGARCICGFMLVEIGPLSAQTLWVGLG